MIITSLIYLNIVVTSLTILPVLTFASFSIVVSVIIASSASTNEIMFFYVVTKLLIVQRGVSNRRAKITSTTI